MLVIFMCWFCNVEIASSDSNIYNVLWLQSKLCEHRHTNEIYIVLYTERFSENALSISIRYVNALQLHTYWIVNMSTRFNILRSKLFAWCFFVVVVVHSPFIRSFSRITSCSVFNFIPVGIRIHLSLETKTNKQKMLKIIWNVSSVFYIKKMRKPFIDTCWS